MRRGLRAAGFASDSMSIPVDTWRGNTPFWIYRICKWVAVLKCGTGGDGLLKKRAQFGERQTEIREAAKRQLAGFRIFVANVETSGRVLARETRGGDHEPALS